MRTTADCMAAAERKRKSIMRKTALMLMLTALCLLLSSCTSLGYVYPDGDEYTSGGGRITGRVEEIDIGWLDGSVIVAYHDGDAIILREESEKQLDSDTELHWRLEGETLQVKYAASGFRALPNLNKQLTVLLPENLRLDEATISVASAQVEADGLNADEIHIQSASGQVALRQSGHAEEIKVETASGGVAVAVEDARQMKITTASGQVVVDALRLDEVKAATASGTVVLQFAGEPDKIQADSVSGNVTIRLPEKVGFTAEVDSVSGQVGGHMEIRRRGDDTYVHGSGAVDVDVDTVSGNVFFEVNEGAGREI